MTGEGKEYIISFLSKWIGHKATLAQFDTMQAKVLNLKQTTGKASLVGQSFSKKISNQGKHLKTISTITEKQNGVLAKYTQTTSKAGKITHKFSRTMDKTKQSTSGLGASLSRLAGRAVLTIPIWLALRRAMMFVFQTIGTAIGGFFDLEEALARIRTVMHGTGDEIDKQMELIKRQILDTAVNTRIALKDLAEGFYFLKTANLSASEATNAFNASVQLAVGTGNTMKETARALAGIYNTMGKYIGDNLTVHEKFQKISDVLAYTYSRSDVQLNELIESYTKLAPYVTGLSDNFTELTTILGYLNTRLLRSGRTGRLTGRAIIQLSKNSDKLAERLGIALDPKKPIGFLNVIEKIRDRLDLSGKITEEQGKNIEKIFATRGGVAVRLLVENFDDLKDQIKDATENADGFAKKMNDIRMNSSKAQLERSANVIRDLGITYIEAAFHTGTFITVLKELNNALGSTKPAISVLGDTMDFLLERLANAEMFFYALVEAYKEYMKTTGTMPSNAYSQVVVFAKAASSFAKYTKENYNIRKNENTEVDKTKQKMAEIAGIDNRILSLRKQQQELIGNKEQESSKQVLKIEEKINSLVKQKTELLDESSQQKLLEKKINEWVLKNGKEGLINEEHSLKLLKLKGATEVQIARQKLDYAKQALAGGETVKRNLEIKKAELNLEYEINKAQQQRLQTVKSLYVQYATGNKEQRKEILNFLKLRSLSPETLGGLYKGSGTYSRLGLSTKQARETILSPRFFDKFATRQQESIIKAISSQFPELDRFASRQASHWWKPPEKERTPTMRYKQGGIGDWQKYTVEQKVSVANLTPTVNVQRISIDIGQGVTLHTLSNLIAQEVRKELNKKSTSNDIMNKIFSLDSSERNRK